MYHSFLTFSTTFNTYNKAAAKYSVSRVIFVQKDSSTWTLSELIKFSLIFIVKNSLKLKKHFFLNHSINQLIKIYFFLLPRSSDLFTSPKSRKRLYSSYKSHFAHSTITIKWEDAIAELNTRMILRSENLC